MKEKKNTPVLILAMIHSIICVFSLRYFSSIIYNSVKLPCSKMEMTDQGGFVLVFHPELLKETLPYYIPLIILHLFIAVLSVLTCISTLRRKMSSRKGIVSYSLLGISAGTEIVYVWMLENILFSYESLNYKKLELSCMMDAMFYNPFMLFGDGGLRLRFLTETGGYLHVKYVFLLILLTISLILIIIYISSKKRAKAFYSEAHDNII